MQQIDCGKESVVLLPLLSKTVLRMKCTLLLIAVTLSSAYGTLNGQTITVQMQNASLTGFVRSVEAQTDYRFVYTREQAAQWKPISIDAKNQLIEYVLKSVFANQLLDYVVTDQQVILQLKKKIAAPSMHYTLSGVIVNRQQEPLPGLSVGVKNTNKVSVTGFAGDFVLPGVDSNSIIEISGAEIKPMQLAVSGQSFLKIIAEPRVSNLDAVVVMAYGETTQRLNTGNITRVTAEEIERQPVANPLATLQGRVAGLTVTQTSGVPGSAFKVEIRGRSSLDLRVSRNDPLFIIDGIPFEPGNSSYNQLVSSASTPLNTAQGGLSPLHNLNPSDIESIEVLKDADATAIYGSRGANGVILISTKRGKPGKLKVSAGFTQGWSEVSRTMDMLHTSQYVAMRKEAFKNDGIEPDNFNAPDLKLWDTTRYTDFKKLLIGGVAHSSNGQVSVSGGNEHTFFRLGANYLRQTNVYSAQLSDTRTGAQLSAGHSTKDQKLSIQFSGSFSADDNRLLSTDLTGYINTIPHLKLYEEDGSLAWMENGLYYNSVDMINPMSLLERKYRSVSQNLIANLGIHYKILPSLQFRMVAGYNLFSSEEHTTTPLRSYAPNTGILPSANFANGTVKSWITEPQLQFTRQIFPQHNLTVLAGASLQHKEQDSKAIEASQYSNDLLLETPEAAGFTKARRMYSQYKYAAAFARVQYDYAKRYLLNLSARQDGSSRFGPGNQYASFGSIGAAWIFSDEKWMQQLSGWLTHAKLRGSYGVTGNDQIGDYQYLSLWSTSAIYQGTPGLVPNNLYNANYRWERNRKAELAMELEMKERFYISASYYINRSSNQLVSYQLPDQTGFSSIIKNLPAIVENKGLELVASADIFKNSTFKWSVSGNISFPKNKLVAFPAMEFSSYNSVYKIGESINSYNGIQYTGMDASTGTYHFEPSLKTAWRGSLDPKWLGGLQNNLRLGNWALHFLWEFRKQPGYNYLQVVRANIPGLMTNQPTIVMQRWQKPGDESSIQQFTTQMYGAAGMAAYYLNYSDAIISDASFLRLRNVQLAYTFARKQIRVIGLSQCKLFVSAQNLLLFTKYKGADPETQNLYALPPLKTLAAGIQLHF